MNRFLLISLTLCTAIFVSAQNPKEVTIAVFTNGLFDRYAHFDPGFTDTTTNQQEQVVSLFRDAHVGYLSGAVSWNRKPNWSHEIELSRLSFQSQRRQTSYYEQGIDGPRLVVSGLDHKELNIVARYSIRREVYSNEMSKVNLTIGIQPYFQQNKYVPEVSNSFPLRVDRYGLRTTMGLGYLYKIGEQWQLQADIYSELTSFMMVSLDNGNPMFPANEQKTTNLNWGAFGDFYGARLGIGYVL